MAPKFDGLGKDVEGVVEYLFRHVTGINRGLGFRFYGERGSLCCHACGRNSSFGS
jgi:hypothetical protein